jgi:hypothetical protein
MSHYKALVLLALVQVFFFCNIQIWMKESVWVTNVLFLDIPDYFCFGFCFLFIFFAFETRSCVVRSFRRLSARTSR